MKQKVLTVIGTRPEAIKLAPVVLELQRRSDQFESIVCATGQHREMLAQALRIFGIQPDVDLKLMSQGQTLADITARAISGLDLVIAQMRPNITLVQGDTTTALCGALSSHYQQVAVGHVEAGLRTGNKYAPFPEEMNRRLVSQLADYHFAPTEHARKTLIDEGIDPETVYQTGNTVIDSLLWVRDRVRKSRPKLPHGLFSKIKGRQVVLVTGHRRESFGKGFENICQAIRSVADRLEQVQFVYPVHLNPNVREPVGRILEDHERIHLVEPLSYEPFVWLMDHATVILTDSGGVQEEAPSLGKPVLVMRDTTERPEGVEAGKARLVGTSRERIEQELTSLLTDEQERQAMTSAVNPYGDGTAAKQIVDILNRSLAQK